MALFTALLVRIKKDCDRVWMNLMAGRGTLKYEFNLNINTNFPGEFSPDMMHVCFGLTGCDE